ncbi:MAG: NADH-quinone oxidoreductase subunit C [Chloroflexi bacterium]|nr:NADH-quinone oxidoreductase subunit C [Chloroflexota bacterium]
MAVATQSRIPPDLMLNLQKGGIKLETERDDMLIASVPKEQLTEAVQHIRDELGGRFITSAGMDMRSLNGRFRVSQLFGLDADKTFLILFSDVDPLDAAIPTITGLIPGANWAEREVRDLIGVTPVGHPDLRRLVLPDDWPNNLYPLRKDFKVDERPPAAPENKVRINIPPKDASVLPIGPFFPTLEEPVFINLFVHGEEIVGMDYRGFYGHRGVEKLGDSDLTYQQVPYLAERICGI